MSDQVLLRDLVAIPDEVHAGDFVLSLAKGVGEKSTITEYVVTEPLAADFDRALGLIKSAVETNASRAAYLDGSFGSGKSHFMAVLYAILSGDPDARGKKGLADIVAKHDTWLRGRTFLLVPYHLPDSQSLDAAILGGYVSHVSKLHPGKPLPAVYRDDELLADAKELRAKDGDERFIAQLPAADDEWGAAWDSQSLDQAFAELPGEQERRRLVGDLLAGPFHRYARAIRADQESYITLDEGLSVISEHAKDVLGYDAIVLLLDELVLWLAGYLGDQVKVSNEAQKVSKLVESAEYERPAPIVSFVPRQRDLRDLVSRDAVGAVATSLFDTLKYWDGRFDSIRLDDTNLPMIVHERLLKPKDDTARRALDEAFARSTTVSAQTWEVLLDTHGDKGDRESFRLTYPFSPAFVHAMVDISGALQRERTALKLMQQLLVDYRDVLSVGQLMPLGSIFDVLAAGADRPFTDKLREEFDQAKRFYTQRVRPYLLQKHRITEVQTAGLSPSHLFRADDLVVKTLLLAALVPNVPALRGLTASRLAALNHGSIVTMLPNQERAVVTGTLKQLSAQFGEIRLSGSEDDPRVDLALIGVDTEGILRDARHADDDAARRRLIKDLLWEELKLTDDGAFESQTRVIWRGTARTVDVLIDNVRDRDRMPSTRFSADSGTLRVILDFPFDAGNHSPADDILRVHELQVQPGEEDTLVWLPHFFSADRIADLSNLVVINHVLERDRLTELTPNLTADDRHHARTQLDSRRSALTVRIREALRRAFGVNSPEPADLGSRADEQVLSLLPGLEPRIQVGQGLRGAFERLCFQLLDHRFPRHPDFDQNGKGAALRDAELETVVRVVDMAAQDKVGRYEVPRADIATMKKIANPLKLGVMHEAAFVLGHDWPQLIEREAAQLQQLRVGDLRGFIEKEQPGLPGSVRDLVVVCYAIQADKAWTRGGQPITMPPLTRLHDDMVLRGQELPTEDEFERASRRAQGIFQVTAQPVLSTRSTELTARAVRERAGALLPAAESLAGELDRHAKTLGLDEEQPRLVTSRAITALLTRLVAPIDSTQSVRLLATAELSRENAIYLAHLTSADVLTAVLRGRNWQVLNDLADRTAAGEDAEAAAIISALRAAARHDEHEAPLAGPLRNADQAGLDLIMSRTKTPPVPPPAPQPGPVLTRRVRASDVPSVVERICEAADANPAAEFEITWRIVTGDGEH
ncbi:MAG TPA: phage resistance protein [Streptosporangiaceae bacterium]|nr:phage resistance protein [Streptosporangiaceae bacterium]